MAIQWSAASGHFLVGLDVSMSPSTVSASTSSVTLTWSVYVKSEPGWWVQGDNLTFTLSGGVTGTLTYRLTDSSGGTQFLAGAKTQTVATSTTGDVNTSVKVRLSGASTGGTPSVTRSASVPARVASPPSAPTGASAKFVSDSRIDVTWTRPSDAGSASTGWQSTQIQRQMVGSSTWTTVASLTGTGASWSDTSTSANCAYVYRVAGVNSSGLSGFSTSGQVATTPAPPTGVAAVRGAGGITVTWTDASPYDAGFEVLDNLSSVGTGVTSPWLHSTPDSTAAHTYRVRAVVGSLTSAWSSPSNTVAPLAAPAAPTGLTPASAASGDPLDLTWTYNSSDTTAQSAFEAKYSTDGGGTWTSTGTVTSTTSSWDATNVGASASQIQWQVRTQGLYQGTDPWSPWSAVQQTTMSHYPIITWQSPDSTVTSSTATISWGFFQQDGHPQIGWSVIVFALTGEAVFKASGTDATSSVSTGPILANGQDYVVIVRAQESSGLWSDAISKRVHVAFQAPLAPSLVVDAHLDRGFVEVMTTARSDGVAPETVSMVIERQIDDGPWVTLDPAASLSSDIIDWTPTIGGVNRYRATAVSALPSSAVTIVEVDAEDAGVADATILLSGGPGFSVTIRFVAGTTSDLKTGRDRTLNVFAGRSRAVETSSVYVPRSVAVSARLLTASLDPADATRDSVQDLFELPGPHLLRDALGRRMFVSLSDVTVPSAFDGQISFTCTEVDPGTVEQRNAISAYSGARIVETTQGEYVIVGGTTLEASSGEYMWSADEVTTLDGI